LAEIVFLSDKNRERYLRVLAPAVAFFVRTRIHPHLLTFTGFMLSIVAGFIYSTGAFFWGACVVILAGTCDALDGQIARKTKQNSPFGAFLDSTLDRFSDVFLLMGLAYYFAGGQVLVGSQSGGVHGKTSPWTVIVIILAITGSFMVSYTRARAEGSGIECKKGLMQRPERITLLIIGSFLGAIPWLGPLLLQCTLILLALSTNITALHRIFHVRKQLLTGNPIE
jgi:CDP-diacylglycerol--glycerol-3-phosphate 3-phosphatidyltransferase